ncbi:MAG: hypothetical protein K8R44_06950 [Sulfurimonas sp.]|nr:hypothetical protein [Sulfurimonas sp.]
MSNLSLHHKLTILKLLYDTNLRITASQLKISNANQYLIPLEEAKLIIRVEVPRENSSPYKVGFVDYRTRKKAKEFLKSHGMLNYQTPFHVLNFDYIQDESKGSH